MESLADLRRLVGEVQRVLGYKISAVQGGVPTFFDGFMLSILDRVRGAEHSIEDRFALREPKPLRLLAAYHRLQNKMRFSPYYGRAAETRTHYPLVWEVGSAQLSASQGVTTCLSWRGLSLFKTAFDFAIYSMLIWELKPRTIIEMGSGAGGSAVWFADLLHAYEIPGQVYSVDLRAPGFEYPKVTFIQGDCADIDNALPPVLIGSLPHPWLIVEDMHVNILRVLLHLATYCQSGDYLVVEDSESKERDLAAFCSSTNGEFRVDTRYTDFFGRNVTCSRDSIFARQ